LACRPSLDLTSIATRVTEVDLESLLETAQRYLRFMRVVATIVLREAESSCAPAPTPFGGRESSVHDPLLQLVRRGVPPSAGSY